MYFSISCTFFSLLITAIKIILLSCCKVKPVIYQDLYACFDVTDHYFELLALNKPDSVHIEHLFHPHSIIWGKRQSGFNSILFLPKKKEEKVYACMNILKVFSYKGTWETIWTRWHSSSCKLVWTLSDNCLIIMMSRCVQRINFMEEMG